MGSSVSLLRPYINSNILLKAGLVDVGIQWGGFALSWFFNTEKFYDLTGSSTFLYLTWATLNWSTKQKTDGGDGGTAGGQWSQRQVLQNSCVSVWALRLGLHLFSRVMAAGEDRRFRTAKRNPALLFTFWTMQAVWVWMTLWPTMIVNKQPQQEHTALNKRDYLGYAMFASGFLIEALADYQKKKFRAQPENEGKFINTGLWSVSRHPNYFGEIMLWTGLFIPATNVITGNEWLSVISPMFLSYLITRISGIPMLEQYADKKWGALPQYQQYKANTACLIPYIW